MPKPGAATGLQLLVDVLQPARHLGWGFALPDWVKLGWASLPGNGDNIITIEGAAPNCTSTVHEGFNEGENAGQHSKELSWESSSQGRDYMPVGSLEQLKPPLQIGIVQLMSPRQSAQDLDSIIHHQAIWVSTQQNHRDGSTNFTQCFSIFMTAAPESLQTQFHPVPSFPTAALHLSIKQQPNAIPRQHHCASSNNIAAQ
ncbi:hypothetical protein Nepgr_008085 [Nepenthes gracilis]|uniref:Uncharacterized protein n=1 Tax=Nepenthes gracilis TaxID=150966 RepID=A0AAD3S847_NEPGR|nr:hypothetical protein Nepgr_008085 [Nepenthes gracilis]